MNSTHAHVFDKHKILDDQIFICEKCNKSLDQILNNVLEKEQDKLKLKPWHKMTLLISFTLAACCLVYGLYLLFYSHQIKALGV